MWRPSEASVVPSGLSNDDGSVELAKPGALFAIRIQLDFEADKTVVSQSEIAPDYGP